MLLLAVTRIRNHYLGMLLLAVTKIPNWYLGKLLTQPRNRIMCLAQNVHLIEVKRGPRSYPKPGGYPEFWTVGPVINPVVTLVKTLQK